MDANPTMKEVIESFLKDNGYDGLYTEECGCLLDDLWPCFSDMCWQCRAGYKGPPSEEELNEGGSWSVGPDKPKGD